MQVYLYIEMQVLKTWEKVQILNSREPNFNNFVETEVFGILSYLMTSIVDVPVLPKYYRNKSMNIIYTNLSPPHV